MKKRFMFAIIGWMGGTLMGWYLQQLTGWHLPVYLGFLTGVLAVAGGEHTGKSRQSENASKLFRLSSGERRHFQ